MPDILADGRFGDDHGIKCAECSAPTFLVDDQGGGLLGYQCEKCDETFQVQYDWPDYEAEEREYDPGFWAHLEEELP